MKTQLKASLELAIEKWLDDRLENGECPPVLFNESLHEAMASAAAAVFDAWCESQFYADTENEPDADAADL